MVEPLFTNSSPSSKRQGAIFEETDLVKAVGDFGCTIVYEDSSIRIKIRRSGGLMINGSPTLAPVTTPQRPPPIPPVIAKDLIRDLHRNYNSCTHTYVCHCCGFLYDAPLISINAFTLAIKCSHCLLYDKPTLEHACPCIWSQEPDDPNLILDPLEPLVDDPEDEAESKLVKNRARYQELCDRHVEPLTHDQLGRIGYEWISMDMYEEILDQDDAYKAKLDNEHKEEDEDEEEESKEE